MCFYATHRHTSEFRQRHKKGELIKCWKMLEKRPRGDKFTLHSTIYPARWERDKWKAAKYQRKAAADQLRYPSYRQERMGSGIYVYITKKAAGKVPWNLNRDRGYKYIIVPVMVDVSDLLGIGCTPSGQLGCFRKAKITAEDYDRAVA